MQLVPLKDLTFNTTNIPDDTTATWDGTSAYAIDTIRQLNNKLYQALAVIDALCDYVYDDSDPLNPDYTYTAIDSVEVADNTAVPCTQNVTVVYEKVDNAYYLYTATTGNVDFTTTDFSASANWSVTTNYRHDLYQPDLTPLKWSDLGYTNKYKLLDQSLSSITEYSGDMQMSFLTTKVDHVFLFNVYGTSVNITVTTTDGLTEYFNEDFALESKNGGTWFNYFFNDFTYDTKLFTEVPVNFEVKITITITGIGGVSKCGLLGIGKAEYLGDTNYGLSVSSVDFSKKIVNDIGETYLEQGKFKRTNSVDIDVPAGLTDRVVNILDLYRATPVVFKGTDIYKTSIIFGIYNKYDTLISTPSISKLTLDLESLT